MFLIFWKGKGFLVLLVTILTSGLSELIWESIKGDKFYYQTHGFPLALALTVSAISIYFIDKKYPTEEKIFIDKQTNQEVLVRNENTFFFIPMKYWVWILSICALVALIFK